MSFDEFEKTNSFYNDKNNLQILQREKCVSEHNENILFVFIANGHF